MANKEIKKVTVELENGNTINVTGNMVLITDCEMTESEKAIMGGEAVKVEMMVHASGKFIPVATESLIRYMKKEMPGLAELVTMKALEDDQDCECGKNCECGKKGKEVDDMLGAFMMATLLGKILG